MKNNLFKILVLLTIICALGFSSIKQTIAVLDFKNKSGYSGKWRIGSGIADVLTTELVKANLFKVIEREKLKSILKEQELGASGMVVEKMAPKLGKLLGCKYIITGSVNEYGRSKGGISLGNFGVKSQTARVACDFRVINTETGEIMFADSGKGKEMNAGVKLDRNIKFGSKGFDSTLEGKATRKAIKDMIKKLKKKYKSLNAMQGKIIKVSGDKVYINLGKNDEIKKGKKFIIYRQGEALTDPDTGEVLDVEIEKIGKIEVVKVMGKISICKIKSGKDFKRGDLVKLK